MQKKPFKTLIAGERIELRRPSPDAAHAAEMFDLLARNEFFYPWRLSLVDMKSAEDCARLVERRLVEFDAMQSAYYDIYFEGRYIGEVYARDIDYNSNQVRNFGYFIDKDFTRRGLASEAVMTLERELFSNGLHRISLFCHFFDPAALNVASEAVARKRGYTFEGTARDVLYDKVRDRYASEHMFSKLSTDDDSVKF
ncbi:MAG: GNAT family N-acetyltransferase [Rickettsiales bacterium]|jgi:RimJ/RimL family protein N-acetyltransferase|nr:GNAT family N-acetyltransferase [Rickettsiales bacterium]